MRQDLEMCVLASRFLYCLGFRCYCVAYLLCTKRLVPSIDVYTYMISYSGLVYVKPIWTVPL